MNDIYVVGDVHGDFKKLIEALVASNWDEKTDKLIFVGDVVDRGIENAKVVNFIADHMFQLRHRSKQFLEYDTGRRESILIQENSAVIRRPKGQRIAVGPSGLRDH